MRVALDVTVIARPGGIAAYARNLILALGRISLPHDLVLWAGTSAAAATVEQWAPPRSRVVCASGLARLLDSAGRVSPISIASIRQLVGPVDVFHGLNHFLPSKRGQASRVVTVHDLSAFLHPEWHPRSRAWAHRLALGPTARAAHHVITATCAIREEVVRVLSVAPERVSAVPHGVSPHFRPRTREEIEPVLARHQLAPGRYLAYLGAVEPRKNLGRLLDAMALLRQERADVPPLVLAGPVGWRNEALAMRLASAGVRHLGLLPEADTAVFLAGAACFVYPSLYEGFGLPVLEALACGVPVVTSTDTAIREVAGDAAVFVDPHDSRAIADGVGRVLADPALRQALTRCGPARAAAFTWERTARETAAVWGRVAVVSHGTDRVI